MSIFQEFMQTVKDVASFVGCLLSCISLITVCVKPVRKWVINKIKTIAHTNELNKQDERITILENQNGGIVQLLLWILKKQVMI